MSLNALFTGSAGLQANSSALDVIGNNLANANTSGFKGQRVQFSDLLYQTLSAGSGPSGTTGGVNPTQVGFGVSIGAVGTSFSQGNLNPTGRTLDFGIQGSGFFVLSDGSKQVYSRAGAFDVDANGFLVDPNTGFRVQRFGTVGDGSATAPGFQTAGDPNIKIPFGAGAPGVPTANVNFQGNISTGLTTGQSYSTAIQIFDNQSTGRSLNVTFTKTATPDTYTVSGTVTGGTVAFSPATVTFDSTTGLLQSPGTIVASFTGLPGTQSVNLNLGTPGQSTGITEFGDPSSATAVTQDGKSSGTLTTVSVDTDGTINGIFSNGRVIPLAQLAIGTFNNTGGLTRSGTNYFTTSASSGEALIGTASTGGRGTIQGGSLENSNVDIAVEFSRLIIAQRGFQVNAKTITVASDVLDQLASIIR
ncbi:flagellar hook protein FlgE [Zavarzinella formosa]|uniref:flagellar hook protein FlgE n=1 Tax=Zavarzinella formosa TaxID=360055 RepID=UPI0002ECA729|nr:flagellar hook protein FlgE [Zavarzinella formosa]